MDIAPVSRVDREVWLALRCALWPDAAADHPVEIDRFFAGDRREPAEVLLAWDDGCALGSVGYLVGWYVAPHARGRGAGRALVEAGEQWARSKGCTEFGSDAEIDNEAGIGAHRALGFTETSRGVNFRKVIAAAAVAMAMSLTALAQHAPSTRDVFYVGGRYAGEGGGEVMAGQMYVEVLTPARVTKKYPLVFFHGAGQTATNWMGTPDGRAGWA